MLGAFDDVHQRAHDKHNQRHHAQEHKDFARTGLERLTQHQVFVQKIAQHRKHMERAHQTQRPHGHQKMCLGKEDAQVRGHDGQQIHQPIKTQRIPQWMAHRDQPQRIFHRKTQRKHPLQRAQQVVQAPVLRNRWNAVRNHYAQAQDNGQRQPPLKALAHLGVALKHRAINALAPACHRHTQAFR